MNVIYQSMTVCIGAICDDGNAVVVASDKMVTFGQPINLQTEPDPKFKKIYELTASSVALFSGSVPDGEEIISNVKANIGGQRISIHNIAVKVKDEYSSLKNIRVEDTILKPLLKVDFNGFQQLITNSSSSQILTQILGIISQHNLQLDILIAGSDDTGCHLWTVTHPGQLLCLDALGYASIGSGGIHASIRLSLGHQSRVANIINTFYNVNEAKKSSEIAPGVGRDTDMALIKDDRITFFDQKFLDIYTGKDT